MKKILLAAIASLALATACKKDDSTPTPTATAVTGTFSGSNEVPAVTTSATGTVTASYDKTSMILTYNVVYSGLTPTAGHFHLGMPGTNGSIIILFPYVSYSPIVGSVLLTKAQETALLAGGLYANLHTATNPGGEIRANLVAQ